MYDNAVLASGIYRFYRKFFSIRECRSQVEQLNVVISAARIVGSMYRVNTKTLLDFK
jgi:hypothetical protein